jgi:putative cell wall-binding protein
MKKTTLLIFLFLIPVFLSNLAKATEVMIATSISYADFVVASVASSKIGTYPYFVEKHLTTETLNEILASNPSKVYIIGGPAVISEESENLLKAKLGKDKVIRIWGMTRYGTSNEVAKYFWPEGSEKAILVWDLPDLPYVNFDVSQMVIAAAEEAQNEGIPLLLIPFTHLPKDTAETLEELGVKEVKIYGNVHAKVFNDLEKLNISYEVMKGEPIKIVETIQAKIRERLNQAKPLVIAAVANWQEGLVVRAAPGGVSLLVFSEDEIPNVVEKVGNIIQTGNVTKILITGKPELAEKIYNALIKTGVNESVPVIWVTGKHLRVLKEIHEQVRETIQNIVQAREAKIQQIKERLAEKLQLYRSRCEEVSKRIREILVTNPLPPIQLIFNESGEMYQRCVQARNYEIAQTQLQVLGHLEKLAEWKLPELEKFRKERIERES